MNDAIGSLNRPGKRRGLTQIGGNNFDGWRVRKIGGERRAMDHQAKPAVRSKQAAGKAAAEISSRPGYQDCAQAFPLRYLIATAFGGVAMPPSIIIGADTSMNS